jgi:YegS/Rv2252/BmrU family lipid kinase
MKTVIVVNPRAGAGRVGRRWDHYNRSINACFGPAEVRFTQASGDATRLTQEAVLSGFERIVVVGGDGTLNECVNGLFGADGTFLAATTQLVLYPAGTGGDFCRSIGLASANLESAMHGATERLIDLGRAQLTRADGTPLTRYFINISSFGSSGLIVDKVNHTTKVLGGKASFLLGSIKGLLAYRNQRVRVQIDDKFDAEMLINTVAVANARYFGGSMKIAPEAQLNDGLFDVVTIEDIGLFEFLQYSGRLYKGQHIGLPGIRLMRGRTVIASALGSSPVLIDIDGEQPGQLPVRYDILPSRLKVYAPWHRAEALDALRGVS